MSYASDSHLVVIPTYNEIDNIEEFIIQISNFDVSVLIVDDNSPDGTGKVVEDITKINKKINLMKRNEKLGLGSCLLYTSPSPRDAHESRMPSSA